MQVDLAYYRRRLSEETAAAAASADPKVCAIHLEFARRYDERISALQSEGLALHLHLVGTA